ncbi:permease prefix domain 1-containing protein [Bacillus sp. FJAT-45350]|uniref:permease prefix domain 1-containing protein n=1 Tax=Bacillus sp. FJAT-45350 TaxID=2011014 RepID=UPI000BB8D015|nr:permease prefix domain 1-containing protein [Bacillus sp. FJAT-45350]
MKKIDEYVDYVYHNVDGNEEEIQELKMEMKTHLQELVLELKFEGVEEEKAIIMAIERFGDENEIRSIVGQLSKKHKVFAKWLLYVALIFLTIAPIIFATLQSKEAQSLTDKSFASTKIHSILDKNDIVSDDIKKEIASVVHGTNYISDILIYDVSNITNEELFDYVGNKEADYQYGIEDNRQMFVELLPSGSGKNNWYVITKRNSYHTLSVLSLFLSGFLYWSLFSIWAMINAYHERRLNLKWSFVFVLFNVVGYLVFRHVSNKESWEGI